MSIDIEWATITSGPDGEALAENVRAFIHDKFQQITLPRFINSVHVHSFSFGNVCPDIAIKDICDPLPDFYEDEEEEDEEEDPVPQLESHMLPGGEKSAQTAPHLDQEHLRRLQQQILYGQGHERDHSLANHTDSGFPSTSKLPPRLDTTIASQYGLLDHLNGHFPRNGTPGIPGGTSNLSYFHLPLGGLSGTQTPLAAVASGTPFPQSGWQQEMHQQFGISLNHSKLASMSQRPSAEGGERRPSSPQTRPSTADSLPSPDLGPPFSPTSSVPQQTIYDKAIKVSDDPGLDRTSSPPPLRLQPSQPSDLQVVARVKYTGDIRMTLTAEILLDYPMPSFVGIPLKLSITGMTFDGVAILAYIRKRMHFCFLSPEDADALVGDELADDTHDLKGHKIPSTGLLREIHVESEIGRKENGKQVLKNVGKVEKFVLEQVRRIFEEEFVFPSYYTFLV